MAAALEAGAAWLDTAQALRDRLEAALVASGATIIAADAPRLPAIGAYRMPGKSATAQLIRFDGMGMAVSAGSACSSGSLRTSHVLEAMAVEGPAEVIRISLGRETTVEAVTRWSAPGAALRAWRDLPRLSGDHAARARSARRDAALAGRAGRPARRLCQSA
jgi:cysteine desulfurase